MTDVNVLSCELMLASFMTVSKMPKFCTRKRGTWVLPTVVCQATLKQLAMVSTPFTFAKALRDSGCF